MEEIKMNMKGNDNTPTNQSGNITDEQRRLAEMLNEVQKKVQKEMLWTLFRLALSIIAGIIVGRLLFTFING